MNTNKTFTIESRDNKWHVYTPKVVYIKDEKKIVRRHMGYFYVENDKLFFQYAGKSFRMAGCKKTYESALKEIDIENKTIRTVNTDRKGRTKALKDERLQWVNTVLPMIIDSCFDKELTVT